MEHSNIEGRTIAVTGSSGFVGSPLVEKMREKGCRVLELDLAKGVDVTDWQQVKSTPKMDCVVHLAGKTFVPDSYENPGDFFRTNLLCTVNALELCRLHKAKMVFASSYVYGIPEYLPINEDHPVSAFNPYASTKLVGEQICKDYHQHFGTRIIILRPFNIYGPGQDGRFLIPSIIDQAKTHKITLKDPQPRRDFVHIDDAVNAYIHALSYAKTEYETFNVASGSSYSVRELCELIAGLCNFSVEINFSGEERPNEVSNTLGDYSKARSLLNWVPNVDIAKGLAGFF